MSDENFQQALAWLQIERATYQTKKFDYAEEAKDLDPVRWIGRFDNYIQRVAAFPDDSPQGLQAALKLAATVIAYCEHRVDSGVPLPKPGYPSGEIKT